MEIIKRNNEIVLSEIHKLRGVTIPNLLGNCVHRLTEQINKENGKIIRGPFVSYKNIDSEGDTSGENIDIEIGFIIDKMIVSKSFNCYEKDAHDALLLKHYGKKEDLKQMYEKATDYLRNNNLKYLNKSYEYYLNSRKIILEIPFN